MSLFQAAQLACLSAVPTAYTSLEREGPSVSGQFQGLPEASELFSAFWEDGCSSSPLNTLLFRFPS